MSNLDQLRPENVFHYFRELCAIPHGSRNTKAISDYCVAFAKERGLEYYQDAVNNVVIIKEATSGYEAKEPVIIQGHLDMVCEKEADCDIDFEKDGLRLYVDGDYLKAEGTTLGGDDGIAVAYALAILDANDLKHPRLECVFTVDEEIGMLGAEAIDLSMLKGHRMLNIDSDVEGSFLTSCAGGLTAEIKIPVTYRKESGVVYKITLDGLLGGHSGSEIDKERANAIIVMGRCLKFIQDRVNVEVISLEGGLKDNAIPRLCTLELLVPEQDVEEVGTVVAQLDQILKKEYEASDKGIQLTGERQAEEKREVLDFKSKMKVIFFLRNMPNGIQNMSTVMPGLVETSLNAGIMHLTKEEFVLTASVRSSVQTRKYDVTDKLTLLAEFLGGELSTSGDYPAWEYRAESGLRTAMAETYRDLYGKEPIMEAIHAGLECGILSGKIEDLDCISFGPENLDIHTPQERLSISSTERVWNLITTLLERL